MAKLKTAGPRKPKSAEVCEVCFKFIRVMCFKGTGVCGERCRKARAGEKPTVRAIANK